VFRKVFIWNVCTGLAGSISESIVFAEVPRRRNYISSGCTTLRGRPRFLGGAPGQRWVRLAVAERGFWHPGQGASFGGRPPEGVRRAWLDREPARLRTRTSGIAVPQFGQRSFSPVERFFIKWIITAAVYEIN
jgi:hypothetical protein